MHTNAVDAVEQLCATKRRFCSFKKLKVKKIMANTISTITRNPIKTIVSKRRKRYQKDGFNLDLTYIKPNVIAMGFPAEKVEKLYRNDIVEVKRFLEKNHNLDYKVYNLCSERTYDDKKWFPHFAYFPFDDHNPPNIKLIQDFCDDVKKWLDESKTNAIAVHCKAGKGRTGTMISCYLLHSNVYQTAQEALACYGRERTYDSKGVTIPSQRRYVDYYGYLMDTGKKYSPVSLQICEMKMTPPPYINNIQGSTYYFSIFNTTRNKLLDSEPLPEFRKTDDFVLIKMNQCIPLAGDFKVEFKKGKGRRKDIFHFWLNTFFIDELCEERDGFLVATLTKFELDEAHKDKHHRNFPREFKIEIVMQKITTGPFANPYHNMPDQNHELEKYISNCHLKNNTNSNHIHANSNGKHIIHNNYPPTRCGSRLDKFFLAGPGNGSCGIDVVDNSNDDDDDVANGVVDEDDDDDDDEDEEEEEEAAAAIDAHDVPSESNSETLSSSDPSSSGEEWESGESTYL